MYARYRTRSRFYKRPEKVLKAYNVSPNFLRRPKVKPGLLHGVYTDEKVDLRDRERLELLESIRHPKERDFYQDHTYHNQWVARDLEKHQKMQLQNSYRYFHPDHEVKKWIWYPGDVVEVIRGEGRGQRGAIIAVVKYKNELLVQNINVQDVTIPATDTRPEQIVQREHPINVSRVQHVDPSTNELCNLELVKVRNKETGELEERRISMETGVLLPIPNRDDSMDVGDPLKDTPIQDADEPTYDASKEMPLLVQRRLQAMENHFIKTLKSSYKFHEKLRQVNARDMQQFQLDVVEQAAEKIAKGIAQRLDSQSARGGAAAAVLSAASNTSLPSWWEAMVAPHVEAVAEEERLRAEEELQRANNDADTMRAENEAMMQEDELDEDEDEDDDDMENPERA